MIKIKKGLDLPIEGSPEQKIFDGPKITKVALIGDDVVGMKPSMEVNVGDKVKKGQLLYTDKKTEGIRYTSPVSGEIIEINRGDKRAFQSVVIKISGDESVEFSNYKGSDVSKYSASDVKAFLLESGAWTSLRERPYSKVANPTREPSSIFVTAIDTHPLSADPEVVLKGNEGSFTKGLEVLGKLSSKVFLCTKDGVKNYASSFSFVKHEEFSGPHPAGLVGTHIHFLDPVHMNKFVWHIGYQEVVALGKLFETGKLYSEKIISIAGPVARHPRLVKTIVGANLSELVSSEVFEKQEYRKISGSVFGGRTATGAYDYLGKFHNQVTLLREGRERHFLGWQSPGLNKFSVKNIFLSKLMPKKFAFTTTTNGSVRSIVPIGSYEKVMPLDILPTYLLRHLMAKNTEMGIKLGAVELDEEDLSLCSFVDPCKNDFGPALRENLTIIEKDG